MIEEAWFIFNRIPTEDKYSLWACRVKRFLPRQMGEFVILPKETLKRLLDMTLILIKD